mgnify:CR=1 FL=1
MNMTERRDATHKTFSRWKDHSAGWDGNSCAHAWHTHLVNMGHEMPEMPVFDSPTSAIRALKERGWNNLSEMLDHFLTRIPPSAMLLGDVALVDGQDNLESILIFMAPRKFMGLDVNEDKFVLYDTDVGQMKGAWRV